jgi:hypothetical protein
MPRSADSVRDRGCQLLCIPPDRVAEIWPHVCGLIRAAAVKCRDLSSYQPVESSVLAGRALLWLVVGRGDDDDAGVKVHAAVVTKLQQNERRKVCVIAACGGAITHEEHQGVDARLGGLCRERSVGMRGWLDLIGPIEDFARAEGCSAMRIIGRAGWARVLPAYRLKNVVLEMEICA